MMQDIALTSYVLEALEALEALASFSPTLSYPSLVSTKQLYASLPLSADSHYIRLLDLEGSSTTVRAGSNAAPLKRRLRVERLVQSSSFSALSYVWGKDDTTTHTVFCQTQGCNIPITANCHAALCQIRKQYGAVTIWVDAICINQVDNAEKSNQIPLMREIYSWAESVYIWLGEGNPQSDIAMQSLKTRALMRARLPFTWLAVMLTRPIKKRQERVDFRHRTWRDPLGRYNRFSFCLSVGKGSSTDILSLGRLRVATRSKSDKVYLNEVLDREWVRRAWTLQEAAMASEPIILCGDKILRWEDLILAIHNPDDENRRFPQQGHVQVYLLILPRQLMTIL